MTAGAAPANRFKLALAESVPASSPGDEGFCALEGRPEEAAVAEAGIEPYWAVAPSFSSTIASRAFRFPLLPTSNTS